MDCTVMEGEDSEKLAAARWSNVMDFVDWVAKRCGGEIENDGGLSVETEKKSVLDVAQTISVILSLAERGEALIERPRMIYLIRCGRDVGAGLALAVENWRTQQEPPDAALLVEAALAMDQPQAAAPVLDWMQTTGYTDPTLAPLAQTLRARLGR